MIQKPPSIIVSHPTGNRNSRAVIEALNCEGWLDKFFTSLAFPWKSGAMAKRSFLIPYSKIHIHPARELTRQLFQRFPMLPLHQHETGFCCMDKIYESIDRLVASKLKYSRPDAVYAYEDGALHTFRKAKELGIHCVYELPIAYGRTSQQLLNEESIRYPNWAHTLDGTLDSENKMLRKREELELADCVICPSEFVHSSIPEEITEKKRVEVIPYGSDPVDLHSSYLSPPKNTSGPLKVLYVGILSQRKGLADLFEAIKLLEDPSEVELHLIGKTVGDIDFYKSQGVRFHYHGTQPRSEVLKRMQQSDVFVLPSIVEGRALVQLEALSQGLPLIISTNTGGEDLITEGETGFIVDIRNPQQIAAKLSWFVKNREKLNTMRHSVYKRAANVTWTSFQKKLLTTLRQHLDLQN